MKNFEDYKNDVKKIELNSDNSFYPIILFIVTAILKTLLEIRDKK